MKTKKQIISDERQKTSLFSEREIKFALRVYRTEESDLIESPWRFLFTNKRISEQRAIIPSVLLGKIAISLWETRFSP